MREVVFDGRIVDRQASGRSGLLQPLPINNFLRGRPPNQVEIYMTTQSMPSTTWRTASLADSSGLTTVDTSALGEHLDVCRRCSGTFLAIQRGAELIHGFFASRFVTTLALIAVVIGLSSLVL